MNELTLLQQSGFKFTKSLGQNFITDVNLLRAIVSDARITPSDFVIEVGAGAGTLTRQLAAAAHSVTAFEIDKSLAPALDALAAQHKNLTVLYGDVLKQDLSAVIQNRPFKLTANLPYYITTPVIFRFLELPELVSLTVMVQKEVALRFTAKPDTPAYGAVTAQLAAFGTPVLTRTVPRTLFTPPPNVDSAVVHLEINKRAGVDDFAMLKRVISAAFAMRRKTLLNNIISGFSLDRARAADVLASANLPLNIRGEALGIESFISIANILAKN
ncbi:MAG: 16S rRNA (adenine(1518)-N(6)/adenine(1519)-N(6))-dimethyltransferase RsmA [Firmicutes bacterium]|nr:16S rRNA (adenine(1518)-N(6)/adenine(1519)-N(6))-dimethyltransferase RsmA [Bacillota bacterium]